MKDFSKIEDQKEFIRMVAEDCIENMSDEDKDYIRNHPNTGEYHFGYSLYIRNHYIHGHKLSFPHMDADTLSSDIMECIFSILLPGEYFADDKFLVLLYGDKFSQLRSEYIRLFGHAPIDIVKRYRDEYLIRMKPLDDEENKAEEDARKTFEIHKEELTKKALQELIEKPEWGIIENLDEYTPVHAYLDYMLDTSMRFHDQRFKIYNEIEGRLIHEVADMVWRENEIRDRAKGYGIDEDDFDAVIAELKDAFIKEAIFVPLEVAFLKFRNDVGETVYANARSILIKSIKDNWRLPRDIDSSWFSDREIAREVLKRGFGLDWLKQFHDDEKMVRFALEKEGYQIRCVSERLRRKRDIILLAAANNKTSPIMALDCMKPYTADDEVVYLACRSNRQNINYIDRKYDKDSILQSIIGEANYE